MNRRYSALALFLFAMGAVALTATEASAMLKDPGRGSTVAPARAYCTYPEDPACNVPALEAMSTTSPSDDSGFGGVQLGASALGGAGVAFGGLWLYRRCQLLAD